MTISPVAAVRLSTYRVPEENADSSAELYADGYYSTGKDYFMLLKNASQTALAACTPWQGDAPLPCVSGAFEPQCLSGMRRCASEAENQRNPELEIKLSGTPGSRNNRLWGIEIDLPSNQELADLFFQSGRPFGGDSGYKVDTFRPDGSPVSCALQSEQSNTVALASDRKVQHLCALGGSSDAELYDLQSVERVVLTLTGAYRQIWIRLVTVLEISMAEAELPPMPPRPPPIPLLPPLPPKLPDGNKICKFFSQSFWLYVHSGSYGHEPCGLDNQQCCSFAVEHGATAYELDDAGCCTLIDESEMGDNLDGERLGYLSDRAGTGAVADGPITGHESAVHLEKKRS
jgi:hypothetical protein